MYPTASPALMLETHSINSPTRPILECLEPIYCLGFATPILIILQQVKTETLCVSK